MVQEETQATASNKITSDCGCVDSKTTFRNNEHFDQLVKSKFNGAMDNASLVEYVASILDGRGYSTSNTILATSLCCDEVARQLEDDLAPCLFQFAATDSTTPCPPPTSYPVKAIANLGDTWTLLHRDSLLSSTPVSFDPSSFESFVSTMED